VPRIALDLLAKYAANPASRSLVEPLLREFTG